MIGVYKQKGDLICMIHKLKVNGRFLLFNTIALLILLYVVGEGRSDYSNPGTFVPELESGKWAIRFLLICLAMTPLRILFGWNSAIKLRKSAGLWSFCFACVHLAFYTLESGFSWLELPQPFFILLGLTGILILLALAVTSNRWAMRRLKKNWKRLHRLVYAAGIIMLVHALLSTTQSKKVLVYDPTAPQELSLYLALLILLLAVRLPQVKRALIKNRKRQIA